MWGHERRAARPTRAQSPTRCERGPGADLKTGKVFGAPACRERTIELTIQGENEALRTLKSKKGHLCTRWPFRLLVGGRPLPFGNQICMWRSDSATRYTGSAGTVPRP